LAKALEPNKTSRTDHQRHRRHFRGVGDHIRSLHSGWIRVRPPPSSLFLFLIYFLALSSLFNHVTQPPRIPLRHPKEPGSSGRPTANPRVPQRSRDQKGGQRRLVQGMRFRPFYINAPPQLTEKQKTTTTVSRAFRFLLGDHLELHSPSSGPRYMLRWVTLLIWHYATTTTPFCPSPSK